MSSAGASADDSSSTSSGEWYQNFQPPPQHPPVEQFECPGSRGGEVGDIEDVGRMEKYSEVSVRGSELTVNGGIQAEAARWPHRGGISSGHAAGMHSSTVHQPGTLSSVLDQALAGGSSKQKDRTVSDGASGAGVRDGHRSAHSHSVSWHGGRGSHCAPY